MSPLGVRRYRAERLLRREFAAMRGRVLAIVRARLRAAGVTLDRADLDACYSQAWHGLYTAMLAPEPAEIANPEGWLALVTYRRALDEHRARLSAGAYPLAATPASAGQAPGAGAGPGVPFLEPGAPERDFADELDDRARLRQLLEGLRGRLSPREREAAMLCYLHGLTRAEAAARMGISPARMRKLMEGPRSGAPGVAAKVGALLESIRAGSYCAEQDSLIRAFALGVLDPGGERYALALAHQRHCSACRARVLALRGLAAVLPPLPLFAGSLLGAAAGAWAGAAKSAAGAAGAGAAGSAGSGGAAGLGAGARAGAGVAGAGGAGAPATTGGLGASVGAGTGGGLAGAGAGGSWLLAGGGVGAKLAVGCLLAAGVGAGCVALTIAPSASRRVTHHPRLSHTVAAGSPTASAVLHPAEPAAGSQVLTSGWATARPGPALVPAANSTSAVPSAARAGREFGPEQRSALRGGQPSASRTLHGASAPAGHTLTARAEGLSQPATTAGSPVSTAGGSSSPPASTAAATGEAPTGRESGSPSSAAREFGPG